MRKKGRKAISLLCALLLVLLSVPISASAAQVPLTSLSIGGQDVTLPGEGETTYENGSASGATWWLTNDGGAYTLTLNSATIQDNYSGIDVNGDLTINLVGENTISSGQDGISLRGGGTMTIGGSGSLDIDAPYGIYDSFGGVLNLGGNVQIQSSQGAVSVMNVNIDCGQIYIDAPNGIYAATITISGDGELSFSSDVGMALGANTAIICNGETLPSTSYGYFYYSDGTYDTTRPPLPLTSLSIGGQDVTLPDAGETTYENGSASGATWWVTNDGGDFTLTLSGATIQGDYSGISVTGGLTINLVSENTVSSNEDGISLNGVGTVTIGGSGSLDIDAPYGIYDYVGGVLNLGGNVQIHSSEEAIDVANVNIACGQIHIDAPGADGISADTITISGTGELSFHPRVSPALAASSSIICNGETLPDTSYGYFYYSNGTYDTTRPPLPLTSMSIGGQEVTLPEEGQTTYENRDQSDSTWWVTNDGGDFTLTLNGLDLQTDAVPIESAGDLRIVLKGVNKLHTTNESSVYAYGQLELSGTGTLEASSANDTIWARNSLTIKGGNYKIQSGSDGLYSSTENIVIESGTFDIDTLSTGGDECIDSSDKDIIIYGGNFTLRCNDNAIEADDYVYIYGGEFDIQADPQDDNGKLIDAGDDIVIADAKISGVSGRHGLNTDDNMIISGASEIDITAGEDAICVDNDFIMRGGQVKLNGEETGIYCYGTFTLEGGRLEATGGIAGIVIRNEYDDDPYFTLAEGANIVSGGALTEASYPADWMDMRLYTFATGAVEITDYDSWTSLTGASKTVILEKETEEPEEPETPDEEEGFILKETIREFLATGFWSKLTDAESGISVYGAFPRTAELTVAYTALDDAEDCDACAYIRGEQKAGNVLLLRELTLDRTFAGKIAISIPVDTAYEGKIMTVLHCRYGELEKLTGVVEDGYLTIQADTDGHFAVLKP